MTPSQNPWRKHREATIITQENDTEHFSGEWNDGLTSTIQKAGNSPPNAYW
jgi:hypothetical protein